MDCTEEYFKSQLMKKNYDYNDYLKYAKENYSLKDCDEDRLLYYFLNKSTFGFGFEPFELDEELMTLIKAVGIKYIEE